MSLRSKPLESSHPCKISQLLTQRAPRAIQHLLFSTEYLALSASSAHFRIDETFAGLRLSTKYQVLILTAWRRAWRSVRSPAQPGPPRRLPVAAHPAASHRATRRSARAA